MAGVTPSDMRPWGRRALIIPPRSARDWMQFAMWELWMGMLLCAGFALGASLIVTSSGHIAVVSDFTNCYLQPPVGSPCERIVYQGGMLNAAFSALCGLTLVGAAVWILWELWSAVEPKPITDDFLRLLNDSFGRSWRNPLRWPWARLIWAYGFTAIGAMLTVGAGLVVWTVIVATHPTKVPTPRVETSQSFWQGR
jgi:hypothetical protein